MGYKLSGFDVIGCCEIDPKMMEVYIANHNPKFPFLQSIQDFAERDDYPEELYNLDILDGSPPCSSFSMAGNRGKDWGKEKKFREGQAEQVLDTLFFDFIKLAKKLQPKVIIAENVKGLLQGEAQAYVNEILLAFADAGYKVDYKLLDASKMGVPQRRERVFFYAIREDLEYKAADLFGDRPICHLSFQEPLITYGEIKAGEGKKQSPLYYSRWEKRQKQDKNFSDICRREEGKDICFSDKFAKSDVVMPTVVSNGGITDFDTGHFVSKDALVSAGSFPTDYSYGGVKYAYLIGMSVPPLMTAHIADAVYEQWLT